jgi:hypothetical protein
VTRAAAAVAAVLATLLVVGAASAQTVDSRVAEALRVEWGRAADRPGIEGYVYNDSAYRIGLVRLAILARDDPAQAPTTTHAWVYGNVPARGRWYFSVRMPGSREVVKVSIESFSVIARDPAAESP